MIFALFLKLVFLPFQSSIQLPIETVNRADIETLHLTEIGMFGIERVARPSVPAHLHTGIDIKRPNPDYQKDQYIFPIAEGVVISKREDGPFAQLILEHEVNGLLFWTVYEHIAGIRVDLFQPVYPDRPIARFFSGPELDTFGWQFDHFHFEILKKRPIELKAGQKNPQRLFNSYTLLCKNQSSLDQHFYDPIAFLKGIMDK